ncbi:hypothetical protein Ana3638_18770 [Anaerocolumna sedimenticola]|uniref:Uncharacterized protein n=1 Tax=Anaerocolumna sedimenticola TaxID=2696063 RepID=A0A6P1TQ24_9FIRM|nr:hypothetical protein [Anaerocolumna sedimenticola]QHQ62573.1 hypothetical protein Ana3638_18770 [Anaerocolumna sedimenticola]
MNKMVEEKLARVLPLMFKEVKIPKLAKETLRQRLFGGEELTDDNLTLVSAAGTWRNRSGKVKKVKITRRNELCLYKKKSWLSQRNKRQNSLG